jgi:hypothetical protein
MASKGKFIQLFMVGIKMSFQKIKEVGNRPDLQDF